MAESFVSLMQGGINPGIGLELDFFLHATLTGVFLLLVYDILRIFRRVVRHGVIWVGVEDFFYWIFGSLLIFCVLLRENNGIIRWFFVVGMLLGMVLYYLCVGRFFVEILAKLINRLVNVLSKAFCILFRPVRMLVHFLVGGLQKRRKKLKKTVKRKQGKWAGRRIEKRKAKQETKSETRNKKERKKQKQN